MEVFRSTKWVIVLTSGGYMSNGDDELGEDNNYLDIAQSPSYSYLKKRFKVRRLICRVCKLKFRTREETQAHIKREHRRIQTKT
ncbi:MAG TPA: hypothetical protein VFR94_23355 [Nitrososphaeraceae archaeon]|nr:hypothetical protein [Nitrososphaeraceae archaeon]